MGTAPIWPSGGMLRLEKCLFYSIQWSFDAEGRATLTPWDDELQLLLSSGDSSQELPIQQFEAGTAHGWPLVPRP